MQPFMSPIDPLFQAMTTTLPIETFLVLFTTWQQGMRAIG
jgi:hypothetical protein